MPQSVFNRYEKKYLMPERVYQELRGRLAPYMQVDFYGLHTICNIYYDTPDDLLIVHFDDVAVYRHLAKIRSHVLSTELRHLRLNNSFLVIRDEEENLIWSCSVCHRQSSFRKDRGLGRHPNKHFQD